MSQGQVVKKLVILKCQKGKSCIKKVILVQLFLALSDV